MSTDQTIPRAFMLLREALPPTLRVVRGTAADSALEQEQRRATFPIDLAHIALDRAPEGVALIEPAAEGLEPRLTYVNESFCRITGLTRDEALSGGLRLFQVEESDLAVRDALLHPLCQRHPFEGEAIARRKNGSEYSLDLLLIPVHESDDAVVSHWIAYLHDVSERKAQLLALQRQALQDVLTQLPNRSLFLDRVEQSILLSRRTQNPVSFIILDLDGFKEVNDTLGHHCGDLLLQQVARRLKDEVRDSDTVARLGGDEFAFVLPTAQDPDAAMRVARKIIRALEKPFMIDDQPCEIGASIGIAIYPLHGKDSATVMRKADTAMYHAKRTGRGCAMYETDLDRRDSRGPALGAELRRAIAEGQLQVFYQPKVHLRTGLVTRVEALVRWLHPRRGLVLPDQFIPMAERTGLIKPLTDWVLDNALEQCSIWNKAGMPIHIAVNLSSRVLQDHLLPQNVARLLDKWKVDPRFLKLEITESSIMADPPQVLAILSLLQTLGVRLSLDDFGTGYSSLVHLRQLPIDEIKIDKQFIMGMANSGSDEAIVRATIDLAHSLGRQVVAEGVDDERTCQRLAALGCDLAQGYSFSRPLPVPAFEQWLADTDWGFTIWRQLLGKNGETGSPVETSPVPPSELTV